MHKDSTRSPFQPSMTMTLVESRQKRLTMLCALYFAQGVPWGFMETTMVNYLKAEAR